MKSPSMARSEKQVAIEVDAGSIPATASTF